MNLNLNELLKIFAQTEEEQMQYFPEYKLPVNATIGTFEVSTRSARFVALCALAVYSKKAETREGELGQRLTEISALSNLLIQFSGIYDWLLWHPKAVCADEFGIVDRDMYEVWSLFRRLCKEAGLLAGSIGLPKSFQCLFSEMIDWPL
jgi:hypothetical protein